MPPTCMKNAFISKQQHVELEAFSPLIKLFPFEYNKHSFNTRTSLPFYLSFPTIDPYIHLHLLSNKTGQNTCLQQDSLHPAKLWWSYKRKSRKVLPHLCGYGVARALAGYLSTSSKETLLLCLPEGPN